MGLQLVLFTNVIQSLKAKERSENFSTIRRRKNAPLDCHWNMMIVVPLKTHKKREEEKEKKISADTFIYKKGFIGLDRWRGARKALAEADLVRG